MTFQNSFDRDHRVVSVTAIGEITVEDLMNNEVEILEDPDYTKNYNMLLDLSRARPHHSVDLDKVKISNDFVESIQEAGGSCKWAVYAPDDSTYAFSRMFEMISMDLSIKTRVFRDKNEAKEWLGI